MAPHMCRPTALLPASTLVHASSIMAGEQAAAGPPSLLPPCCCASRRGGSLHAAAGHLRTASHSVPTGLHGCIRLIGCLAKPWLTPGMPPAVSSLRLGFENRDLDGNLRCGMPPPASPLCNSRPSLANHCMGASPLVAAASLHTTKYTRRHAVRRIACCCSGEAGAAAGAAAGALQAGGSGQLQQPPPAPPAGRRTDGVRDARCAGGHGGNVCAAAAVPASIRCRAPPPAAPHHACQHAQCAYVCTCLP
jgi:hypothetical protein